jgi:hypothetical protein
VVTLLRSIKRNAADAIFEIHRHIVAPMLEIHVASAGSMREFCSNYLKNRMNASGLAERGSALSLASMGFYKA